MVREQRLHQLCKFPNSSPHHPENIAQSTPRKGFHFSYSATLRTQESMKQVTEGINQQMCFLRNCVLKVERRLPPVCLPRLHPRRAEGRSTSSQKLEIHKNTARPKHPPRSCTPLTQESDTCQREKVHQGCSAARLKSLVVAPGLIS